MTRFGSVATGGTCLVLVLVLVWAATESSSAEWRTTQARYHDLVRQQGSDHGKRLLADEWVRPHEVHVGAAIDRCTTCHLGVEVGADRFEPPFAGHPEEVEQMVAAHPISTFGCTSCHGGQGRSLERAKAHDHRRGGGWSAFDRDGAVRCGRCHPAAGMKGTELVARGVDLFFEHGCSGCHQPGRPGPGIGPDLASIGLRGEEYLTEVVLSPEKVYPQTIMPPMRFKLSDDGEEITALVGYLRTLEPWPLDRPRVERTFDPRSCTGCHDVSRRPGEPTGPGHRCSYLHDESEWLACGRCHGEQAEPSVTSAPPAAAIAATEGAEAPPLAAPQPAPSHAEAMAAVLQETARPVSPGDPTGACPHLEEAFSSCGVCHRQGEHQRPAPRAPTGESE